MRTQSENRVSLQSYLDFKLMSLTYKLRDLRAPRINVLREVVIQPGFIVLDYGCGPGSYIAPLSALVGMEGKVYALDINPLAVKEVKKMVFKKKLANVETILSDCMTGLPSGSTNIVLLYDILHDLEGPDRVLAEIHGVLKTDAILSVSDHHLKENEVISRVIRKGLFKLSTKGNTTFGFLKKES